MSKIIQIEDVDGNFLPNAFELVWGVMHFPNDAITAQRFAEISFKFKDVISFNSTANPPKVLKLLLNEMDVQCASAMAAGLTICFLNRMYELNLPSSIGRAQDMTKHFILDLPNEARRELRIPVSTRGMESALKENKFRSVAHLWAAYIMLGELEKGLGHFDSTLQQLLFFAEHQAITASWAAPDAEWDFLQFPPASARNVAGRIPSFEYPGDSVISKYAGTYTS